LASKAYNKNNIRINCKSLYHSFTVRSRKWVR